MMMNDKIGEQSGTTNEQRRVVKYGLTAEQLAEVGGDPIVQLHFRTTRGLA